ncbi:formin-like protein 3 isoform X2 [Callorhinchus milii]|uniref:formin-like protein 3 isoform X2 n=1 Tax=Callorhinchus milii TaxID=7868 RepID=UPI001C3F94EE|nr:formin-like protein 3 isoform X2 [Callorhinchus milii]
MGNNGSLDKQTDLKPHTMPLKLPIPEQSELEERFSMVLNSMNLPPDKARLLRQYDNEKKWDLICDQERFQVKNPPHTYIQKLKSYLDPTVTRKKFRQRVQESTKVLRELEISLRTNHIGWVREFLNDDNQGLNVLVNYLSFAQCAVIYNTLPDRKTLKNSRLVCHKDDVHVCIMCLRAIMNYQYGFNLVMSHLHAVNEIALSLNNKNPRTKALVLELLAAVCLVRGGHEIILSAFDHFKEVCKEKHRFENLMEYFRNEDSNIDFMVACMQFINIVVHSVEDMNFRVHLQFEFTKLGLDEFLEKSKHTESDKLQVQIQAYLDNVFDVGGLLEDAETKNAALEKVEELEEHLSHLSEKLHDLENDNMMRVAELEKQLLFRDKELEAIKETYKDASSQVHTLRRMIKEKEEAFQRQFHRDKRCQDLEGAHRRSQDGDMSIGSSDTPDGLPHSPTRVPDSTPSLPPPPVAPPLPGMIPPPPPPAPVAPPLPGSSLSVILSVGLSAIRIKKPIKTKFRLPVFNWMALKPNQINGTVFTEIDDEKILEELNLDEFEDLFKTKAQGPALEVSCQKAKSSQKSLSKVTLLEANRAKNLAITLRKAGKTTEEICRAIQMYDLKTLPLDFVECLNRFLPLEAEVKLLKQYEKERKPLDDLSNEDRFMLQFCKIERLPQRMTIMTFIGNFADNLQMLNPQLNAIIAASASIKSSQKLKRMLEIILALGNYMNSSKRGSVYGFKLQSLDLLLDTKSTDRKLTLLHYIAIVIKEKYAEITNFWSELHFIDKAAAVSLENVLLDVKEMGHNMELIRRECSRHDHNVVLKEFLARNEANLEKLQKDSKTAQEAYSAVVGYFGENPKTTPPSVFFPVFVRFVKSYREAEQENEQRKKQEQALREKMLAQEVKQQQQDQKSPSHRNKRQQQELIAELRRRQVKEHRPVYEGKDGAIEDIITVLKSAPFTARTAKRGSRFFAETSLSEEFNC